MNPAAAGPAQISLLHQSETHIFLLKLESCCKTLRVPVTSYTPGVQLGVSEVRGFGNFTQI